MREQSLIQPALALWGPRPLDTLRPVDGEQYLVTRRTAVRRIRDRRPRPVSASTIAREVALLTAVFGRARDNYPDLPVIIRSLKHKTVVRDRVVTLEEQPELLRRLPRHYARFTLTLLGTGIRLSEALGINPETDIDWEEHFLTVTGKGSKTRRVPLFPAVAALLRAELADRPTLWQTWDANAVTSAFRRACAEEPAMPRATPHTLRHTFGWRWLTGSGDRSKRGDLYSLCKVLGHSSVAITERHYAHLKDQDLRDTMLTVDVGVSAESVQPIAPSEEHDTCS